MSAEQNAWHWKNVIDPVKAHLGKHIGKSFRHMLIDSSDPVYRFYFDGSPQPGFEIRHSEFGAKAPFVAPLVDKYSPDLGELGGAYSKMDFQIVRSFCPMPFSKSLKITSSVKLQGNHTTRGHWDPTTGGGFGHAIWHSYPSAEGITTFSGSEEMTRNLLDIRLAGGCGPRPLLVHIHGGGWTTGDRMEYNRAMKLPAGGDGDAIHHPVCGIKMWEKSKTAAAGTKCPLRFSNPNKVPEYRKTTTTSYASGEEFLLHKLLAQGGSR